MGLKITSQLSIPLSEIQFQAIRAQGSGGQNVNKVSSAVHLRFNINESSLPDNYREGLLKLSDQRITDDGVIVIKAQRFRSQDKNREESTGRAGAHGRRDAQKTQAHQTKSQQPEETHGQQNQTRPTQIPAWPC